MEKQLYRISLIIQAIQNYVPNEIDINLEKLLDLAIEDMQEELLQLRQSLIPVMVRQKRTQQQYEQVQAEVNKWQKRARLAVQKNYDHLARQALEQKIFLPKMPRL
ncbi:PspA/IM30 family protein [Chlorogloeopsis sp. ULAP01]|uniref:PspA/IM30 family protein n=1 Tax=Chlorogloeopsis sp. ULAP01 TaxID=3056483 RepID=UPI0025AA57A7|nr:PspA/IM30 family protein [Chlorogloeopsis sp. ULAP01]MDM9384192.1 PspA/IM30 family protein [Chlorogloeopsis sp. ULAP01]